MTQGFFCGYKEWKVILKPYETVKDFSCFCLEVESLVKYSNNKKPLGLCLLGNRLGVWFHLKDCEGCCEHHTLNTLYFLRSCMGEVCPQKNQQINTNIYTKEQKQHISSHISGQNCSTFNEVDQSEQNNSLYVKSHFS